MITQIIENTFNHLLASDHQGKQSLIAHQGKSIGFDIKPMALQLIATITHEGLRFSTGSVEQADCIIRGTPIALIRYMKSQQVNPSTNHLLEIEIGGDLEFARKISIVFRSLDVDWEEIISTFVGDAPAYQLSKLFSGFRSGLEKSKDSARQHLNYIISERMDQLVSAEEAEVFYQQVDKMAIDASRIEQQINLLIEVKEDA